VQTAKDAQVYWLYCVILTGILCRWSEAIDFDDERLVMDGGLVMPAFCHITKLSARLLQVLRSGFVFFGSGCIFRQYSDPVILFMACQSEGSAAVCLVRQKYMPVTLPQSKRLFHCGKD
jgi:hypothetical protein